MQSVDETKNLVLGLEAFKGHKPDEYHYLIEPLSEFISQYAQYGYNLYAINNLAKAIISAKGDRGTETNVDVRPSVTARFLAEQIRTWVEDIRLKLFDTKSAPFNRKEDAQRWWNEAEKKADEWHKRADEWHKRADEWHKRADEWEAFLRDKGVNLPLTGAGYKALVELRKQGLGQKLNELEQARDIALGNIGEPPEYDKQVKVLFALLDAIISITDVTPFWVSPLEMYILANISPELPSITYRIFKEHKKIPGGENISYRYARIFIHDHATFQDLLSTYNRIRRDLGIKRTKHSTTNHLHLFDMVEQKGGIPRGKGTVAFWESIKQEWNKKHPKTGYTTWKGVKIAYDRLYKKYSERYLNSRADSNTNQPTEGGTP